MRISYLSVGLAMSSPMRISGAGGKGKKLFQVGGTAGWDDFFLYGFARERAAWFDSVPCGARLFHRALLEEGWSSAPPSGQGAAIHIHNPVYDNITTWGLHRRDVSHNLDVDQMKDWTKKLELARAATAWASRHGCNDSSAFHPETFEPPDDYAEVREAGGAAGAERRAAVAGRRAEWCERQSERLQDGESQWAVKDPGVELGLGVSFARAETLLTIFRAWCAQLPAQGTSARLLEMLRATHSALSTPCTFPWWHC